MKRNNEKMIVFSYEVQASSLSFANFPYNLVTLLRVATRSGKNENFSKVREFCKKSVKISVLVKVSEKSGNFFLKRDFLEKIFF